MAMNWYASVPSSTFGLVVEQMGELVDMVQCGRMTGTHVVVVLRTVLMCAL